MSQEQQSKPDAVSDASTKAEEQPNATTVRSEEQEHKQPKHTHAVTYGDVFPAAAAEQGPLAGETITSEDAALMQTAESMAFGHTIKGGAASAMQAAAAKNVEGGFVDKDAHSRVSEYGVSVTETSVPGATMDIEYVAGQAVFASAHPTPTDPAIAALDAVTIGEALEATAVGAGDRPVQDSDARAIESAERRATGVSMPMKGGIGATAQSAAQTNHTTEEAWQTSLADVLMDATSDLPADKVVTYEDAVRVIQAEVRGGSIDDLKPGGVGATLLAAADLNEQAGLIPPPPESIAEGRQMDLEEEKYQQKRGMPPPPESTAEGGLMDVEGKEEKHEQAGLIPPPSAEGRKMDFEGEEKQDKVVEDDLRQYEPLSSQDNLSKEGQGEVAPPAFGSEKTPDLYTDLSNQTASTEEETTPLVSSNGADEQLPSHGGEALPPPKQTEV